MYLFHLGYDRGFPVSGCNQKYTKKLFQTLFSTHISSYPSPSRIKICNEIRKVQLFKVFSDFVLSLLAKTDAKVTWIVQPETDACRERKNISHHHFLLLGIFKKLLCNLFALVTCLMFIYSFYQFFLVCRRPFQWGKIILTALSVCLYFILILCNRQHCLENLDFCVFFL